LDRDRLGEADGILRRGFYCDGDSGGKIASEDSGAGPIEVPSVLNGEDGVLAGRGVVEGEAPVGVRLVEANAVRECRRSRKSRCQGYEQHHDSGDPFGVFARESLD
jgi:hypothetical protein